MPDDHSKVAPLLPIPNRTVKRLSADDSADSRVKVGHRQACMPKRLHRWWGRFLLRLVADECKRKRITLASASKDVLESKASLIAAGC